VCESTTPDRSSGGLTSLAGLLIYLDLVEAVGLGAAIRRDVHVVGSQGWLDIQAGADLAESGRRRSATYPTGPGTVASRRITGSWRSASRCASYRSATKRNCRSQRRTSARRAPTNCSLW
jgi:hypothetical protein